MTCRQFRGAIYLTLLWSACFLAAPAAPADSEPLQIENGVPHAPGPQAPVVPSSQAPVVPSSEASDVLSSEASGVPSPEASDVPSPEGVPNPEAPDGTVPEFGPPPAPSEPAPSTPTTLSPIVILPTATPEAQAPAAPLDLDFQGRGWSATVRGQSAGTDGDLKLTVSTWASLGSRLRTFTEWRREDGPTTVRAGLEGSLFGPDHWRASRTVQPFELEGGIPPTSEISVGVDVLPGARLQVTGTHSVNASEIGTGWTYDASDRFQWATSLKARKTPGESFPWTEPAVEGSLRWCW